MSTSQSVNASTTNSGTSSGQSKYLESGILYLSLVESRRAWIHFLFEKHISLPADVIASLQESIVPLGTVELVIGPHIFSDTAFYEIKTNHLANPEPSSITTTTTTTTTPDASTTEGIGYKKEASSTQRVLVFEFKENPGTLWRFPIEAVVESTSFTAPHDIVASFFLDSPSSALSKSMPKHLYNAQQTHHQSNYPITAHLLRATESLWHTIQDCVMDVMKVSESWAKKLESDDLLPDSLLFGNFQSPFSFWTDVGGAQAPPSLSEPSIARKPGRPPGKPHNSYSAASSGATSMAGGDAKKRQRRQPIKQPNSVQTMEENRTPKRVKLDAITMTTVQEVNQVTSNDVTPNEVKQEQEQMELSQEVISVAPVDQSIQQHFVTETVVSTAATPVTTASNTNTNTNSSSTTGPTIAVTVSNATIAHLPSAIKKCTHCGCKNTPMWRRGPYGAGTLCNACGVKWKHGKILQHVSHVEANEVTLTTDVYSASAALTGGGGGGGGKRKPTGRTAKVVVKQEDLVQISSVQTNEEEAGGEGVEEVEEEEEVNVESVVN